MRHAIVVVGANYGDEGKGLITDYLTHRLEARYVARFNGGAQAGHTVHRSGKRHVFSTYGAGTFEGAQTILTSDFIINPFAALKEYELLRWLGEEPQRLIVSRNSPVTTQFELLINQMAERFRFGERHGSCGLGINETITRHLALQKDSIAGSLFDCDDKLLRHIAYNHFPLRLVEHGIGSKLPDKEWNELLDGDDRIQAFKLVMEQAKDELFTFRQPKSESTVYEGAQGLALDEFMGDFPHVTRSNTGIANALDHINSQGGNDVVAVYVTRTFLTRHGAGTLKHEMAASDVLGKEYVDETNKTNEWQQSFRYAPLNIPETAARIKADIARNKSRIKDYGLRFVPTIAVTFMDQQQVLAIRDEAVGPERMTVQDVVQSLQEQAGCIAGLQAWGRTGADVEAVKSVKYVL